jgi:hypothetical protein
MRPLPPIRLSFYAPRASPAPDGVRPVVGRRPKCQPGVHVLRPSVCEELRPEFARRRELACPRAENPLVRVSIGLSMLISLLSLNFKVSGFQLHTRTEHPEAWHDEEGLPVRGGRLLEQLPPISSFFSIIFLK